MSVKLFFVTNFVVVSSVVQRGLTAYPVFETKFINVAHRKNRTGNVNRSLGFVETLPMTAVYIAGLYKDWLQSLVTK